MYKLFLLQLSTSIKSGGKVPQRYGVYDEGGVNISRARGEGKVASKRYIKR